MEIKICGITRIEDALQAIDCGADALGFIFHEKSPRFVSPEQAKRIIDELPDFCIKVGVFVNMDIPEVLHITEYCRLDMVQLHGDESPEYCRYFPDDILIKSLSPSTERDLMKLHHYRVRAILIDSRDATRYGGTGKPANWHLAKLVKETHSLILAGGLNCENILHALQSVMPQAVDVNSGIEDSPGRKNHEKMKHIVELVHGFGKKNPKPIFTSRKYSQERFST